MSGEVEDGAKQATDSNAIVVVTVHGTNDAEAAEDGTRWWQRGSAFAQQLVAELKHRGLLRFVHCTGQVQIRTTIGSTVPGASAR